MIWTLLAPELVLWWAGRQWLAARRISREQSSKHEYGTSNAVRLSSEHEYDHRAWLDDYARLLHANGRVHVI